MDETLGVDVFQAREQLIRNHEHCFQFEASSTVIEEVLERRSKQVEDHDVVVALNAVPPNIRDADCGRGVSRGETKARAGRIGKPAGGGDIGGEG